MDATRDTKAYRRWLVAAVAVVVVAPRVFRLSYPWVWIEDAKYLYHAFALSIGQHPYVDGIYAHPPTFEGILAVLFSLFGVSYRVAEVFTALVVAVGALLLYDLCRRVTGRWSALAACAVFGFSPLLFRYHVFEREVLTVCLAIAALWVQAVDPRPARSSILAGGLVGVALAIKLSAVFYVAPLLLLFWWTRSPGLALRSLVSLSVVGGGAWALIFIRFGESAYAQSILLHFVKGGTPPAYQIFLETFVPQLNILLVTGFGGLVLGSVVDRRPLMAAAMLLFAEVVVFFAFVSESIVPHNVVDLLLPLALGTGYGCRALSAVINRERAARLPIAVVIGGALSFVPFGAIDEGYLISGWGYVHREELREVSRFVREHVPLGTPVCAPQHVAAEAGRIKLIDDRELTGPYLWMLEDRERDHHGSWAQLAIETIPLWSERVDSAIAERRVGAVVWDTDFPEWIPHYLRDVEREACCGYLSSAGYSIRYRGGPYVVWLPEPVTQR